MNLREEILEEHSKARCMKIVAWVGNDQKRFDELFGLFLSDEYRVVQRSARPVSYCVHDHPQLIRKHWAKLVKNIMRPDVHGAVKRNTMRLLQYVDIPEKYRGDIMNLCFEFIQSAKEKVAVKAFAITVLERLAKHYPEIIGEVTILLEERIPIETAAFKSRTKQFIKNTAELR